MLMFDKQLIVKIPCEDDKRAYWVSFSKSGKRSYFAIVPKAQAWEADLLAALDDDLYSSLSGILRHLEARLDGAQC